MTVWLHHDERDEKPQRLYVEVTLTYAIDYEGPSPAAALEVAQQDVDLWERYAGESPLDADAAVRLPEYPWEVAA